MNIRLARAETERQVWDLKKWANEPNDEVERKARAEFVLSRILSFLPASTIRELQFSNALEQFIERFGLPKPDRRGYKGVGEEAGPKGDLS